MYTLSAASWMFGFLLPMRRLRERMASLGCTVFERMTSEISRLSAMSSLYSALVYHVEGGEYGTYKLLAVARSIWPSSSLLPELNQPAMMGGDVEGYGRVKEQQKGVSQREIVVELLRWLLYVWL